MHKQRREHHQGPAITRNAPNIWQQTYGAAANKWAHSAGSPPPNPLRERDYHSGRRPTTFPPLFSPVEQIVLPLQPSVLDSSGQNYSTGHVDSHAVQEKKARGKKTFSWLRFLFVHFFSSFIWYLHIFCLFFKEIFLSRCDIVCTKIIFLYFYLFTNKEKNTKQSLFYTVAFLYPLWTVCCGF